MAWRQKGDKPLSEPMMALFTDAHIDGLVQDCSNSSALAVELLQSCTKPSICISQPQFVEQNCLYKIKKKVQKLPCKYNK